MTTAATRIGLPPESASYASPWFQRVLRYTGSVRCQERSAIAARSDNTRRSSGDHRDILVTSRDARGQAGRQTDAARCQAASGMALDDCRTLEDLRRHE